MATVINVEASGRHVHLSRADVEALFGKDYQLTKLKDLSQPGQFACKERISVRGPKGTLHNVIVLGPERPSSQVEVSFTDANALGLRLPVRQSGDLGGSPGVTLSFEDREVGLDEGVIVAQRHVHITPEDATKYNVEDNERVQIKMLTDRPVIFDDVVVRVHENFATYMHIDYDEANACAFTKEAVGEIIK